MSVLIADGLRLFSESLAMALWWSDDVTVLSELPETGERAVEAAVRLEPCVALIDYWMPGLEGPAIAAALKERGSPTKVILLSWLHGVQEINRALSCGAAGFLTKSVSVDQVTDAIRRAHAGETPVFREELKELAEKLQIRTDRVMEMRRRLASLTPREMTVLRLFAEGRSGRDIADALGIAPHTVSLHFHNLVQKTEAVTKEQAVAMARYCGIIRT